MKYLHNNEVYWKTDNVDLILLVVMSNLFQENIKRDKLSSGEMPNDNTNQPSNQTKTS